MLNIAQWFAHMADDKEHFSSRISSVLIQKIKDKAKDENTSITAIVEEAFKLYFKDELPGICPSYHHQNNPDAIFCSQCGLILDNEKRMNKIEELESQVSEMQRRIESLESFRVEQIGNCIRVIRDKKKKS